MQLNKLYWKARITLDLKLKTFTVRHRGALISRIINRYPLYFSYRNGRKIAFSIKKSEDEKILNE